MRYLLDTCIFIHYAANRDLLSSDVFTDDGKFEFYRNQGLELIVNKK